MNKQEKAQVRDFVEKMDRRGWDYYQIWEELRARGIRGIRPATVARTIQSIKATSH